MNLGRSIKKRLLRKIARQGASVGLTRRLGDILGHAIAPLAPYDTGCAAKLAPLGSSAISQVVAPKTIGSSSDMLSVPNPDTAPLLFKEVTAYPDCSLFLRDGRALAPAHACARRDRVSWQNGASCSYDEPRWVALTRYPDIRIEKGICAFGHGAINWYHWLIEILPTVMLSEGLGPEYDDFPLLVPEHVMRIPNFKETLMIFSGDRQILPLPAKHRLQIGEMLLVPSPVYGPYNMYAGFWPTPADYLQDVEVLARFRSRILEATGATESDGASPRRVFLARPADKRGYNQEEIERVANDHGFVSIRPETLSFAEQVKLFHHADIVIGATGAAWACSLFMRSGAKGLIWALKEYAGGCFFSNLSLVSGSDISYQFVQADRPVTGTQDAHFRDYHVPVDVFARNLEALCPSEPAR
ncbi:MAG: glycosyltransferase family 61 protein [Pseudomonadota bacterium]